MAQPDRLAVRLSVAPHSSGGWYASVTVAGDQYAGVSASTYLEALSHALQYAAGLADEVDPTQPADPTPTAPPL